MHNGLIFDIKRLSTDDGPGIRTTVFMKGCPLRCAWCASPESLKNGPEISFNEDKCVLCGLCVEVCPPKAQEIDGTQRRVLWDRCNTCGECVKVCPSMALRMVGKQIKAEDLLKEIEKDKVYYDNSGGGVTVSGGEPTMQLDFLEQFLRLCKENRINTALDTSGYLAWSQFERIVDLVDLFLYDLKHVDEKVHKKLTGVSNVCILKNLEKLACLRKSIIVRIPIIPNYNDTPKNITQSKYFLSSLCIKRVDLLPFNKAAGSKYKLVGKNYILEGLDPPSNGTMNRIKAEFESAGIETCIGR
jgi:pyruvate formate lyase activating enzyme